MSAGETYNAGFYSDSIQGSLSASQIVLPMLFDGWLPGRIVDVGCGLGAWCATASRLGVPHFLGLDGTYVDQAALLIPADSFQAHDLEAELPRHLQADLAICIEVAEHLSIPRAEGLVADLCRIAPIVLFSAAVPYQGGSGHVNEHWPEYWAGMFERCGFSAYDSLRDRTWSDARIPWWYRQNLLVFARPEVAAGIPALGAVAQAGNLAKIHPELFLLAMRRRRLETARQLGDDLAIYQQTVAGAGLPIGYGQEFDIVFR